MTSEDRWSPAVQEGRVGGEMMLENSPISPRDTRADLAAFRFPPTPPLRTPAGRLRSRENPPEASPGLDGQRQNDFSSTERTPRSSLEFLQLRHEPDQPASLTESVEIPFLECNILFLVNGGSHLHRGFKNFAHQLLCRRTSNATPQITRMIFWNTTFNQYIVQEITIDDGNLSQCVAEVGSCGDLSRLLPIQREADLVVVFTTLQSVALSPRSVLGPERFSSEGLQNIPHILVIANEHVNKPSPKDAFRAAHHFTNLEHIAVLYQSISQRDSLGPCQVLHINGCLERLRPRGNFNGRAINNLVEWLDLPVLALAAAMERLVLTRNPTAQIPVDTLRITPMTIADRRRGRLSSPLQVSSSTASPTSNSAVPPPDSSPGDTRAAARIRRISQLIVAPARDHAVLERLQRELRTEHRRNSRLPVAIHDRSESTQPDSTHNALSMPVMEQHTYSTSESFRGECQLCCEEDSQLVFLFKQSFHESPSMLAPWPLAVGPLPENDIISAFMCCDNCSFYVVEQGSTPIREPATGAFSLIPYTTNVERWVDDLGKGLSHYKSLFSAPLPLIFLAIVEETLRTKSWAQSDGSEENELRRSALLWTKNQILTMVHVTEHGHSGFVGDWIRKIVLEPNRKMNRMLWQYPLPGFTLMLGLLTDVPVKTRARVTWARMLLEITRHMRSLILGNSFAHFAGLVISINEMLIANSIGEDEWLAYIGAEGVLPEKMMEALRLLKEETEWIRTHARYAMVMWLSWMPGLWGVLGTTGDVMEVLVEEKYGEVVVMAPDEVGKEWCASL